MEKKREDFVQDPSMSGLVSSAIASNPYSRILDVNDFKPSKHRTFGNKICCYLCGETNVTLHKKQINRETVYICQDCKLTEALLEEDE